MAPLLPCEPSVSSISAPNSSSRSEEHTSELQSQSNLVCRLLLEKKKIYHQAALRTWVGSRHRHLPSTPSPTCRTTVAAAHPPTHTSRLTPTRPTHTYHGSGASVS